jgi:hypothetical protein
MAIYIPGQFDTATDPAADGTWGADIVVPSDAPPSDSYTITALCATRLTLDSSGLSVNAQSVGPATVTSGPITIADK